MGKHFSEIGNIYLHDKWQFELKSDFLPNPAVPQNIYSQEFFIFVPNALQIQNKTYTRADFYRDQTNYVRYKTPEFTFENLLDPNNRSSPLVELSYLNDSREDISHIEFQIKLLGNIFRSTLRDTVSYIAKHPSAEKVKELCKDIRSFREREKELAKLFTKHPEAQAINQLFQYLTEFNSNTINTKLSHLYQWTKDETFFPDIENSIVSIMREEQDFRENYGLETEELENTSHKNEYIVYRRKLLDKFIAQVLFLNINRFSTKKAFRNVIGAFSAGIAMLVFMILFVHGGEVLVINSTPFIMATVLFYILKDRIKEGLRNISFKIAFKWFPDYTTKIYSNDNQILLGELKESFSLINRNAIPKEIENIRKTSFRTIFDQIKRPETVIYHKKTVDIHSPPPLVPKMKQGLNIIFRLNIFRFLHKASDPLYTFTKLDKDNQLISVNLPKVYHLNIIVKNTFMNEDLEEEIEYKNYRVVIDKNGIHRVETLS